MADALKPLDTPRGNIVILPNSITASHYFCESPLLAVPRNAQEAMQCKGISLGSQGSATQTAWDFAGFILTSSRNVKPVGWRTQGWGTMGVFGGTFQRSPIIPLRFSSPGPLPPTCLIFLQMARMRLGLPEDQTPRKPKGKIKDPKGSSSN